MPGITERLGVHGVAPLLKYVAIRCSAFHHLPNPQSRATHSRHLVSRSLQQAIVYRVYTAENLNGICDLSDDGEMVDSSQATG
jgi:hypothetical protein